MNKQSSNFTFCRHLALAAVLVASVAVAKPSHADANIEITDLSPADGSTLNAGNTTLKGVAVVTTTEQTYTVTTRLYLYEGVDEKGHSTVTGVVPAGYKATIPTPLTVSLSDPTSYSVEFSCVAAPSNAGGLGLIKQNKFRVVAPPLAPPFE